MAGTYLEDDETLQDREELNWFTSFIYASLTNEEWVRNSRFSAREISPTNSWEKTQGKKGIFTWVAMNFRDSTILVAREIAEILSSYDLWPLLGEKPTGAYNRDLNFIRCKYSECTY